MNQTVTMTFYLADFAPNKLEVIEKNLGADKNFPFVEGVRLINQLTLRTDNDKPAVGYVTRIDQDGLYPTHSQREGKWSTANGVYFTDRALAERVAKAFAHAIRLSGGKVTKEVF